MAEYTPLPAAALHKSSFAAPTLGKIEENSFGGVLIALAVALVGGVVWLNQAPRPVAISEFAPAYAAAPQRAEAAAMTIEQRPESPSPLLGESRSQEDRAGSASQVTAALPEPPTAAGESIAAVSGDPASLGGDAGGFVSWKNKVSFHAAAPSQPARAVGQACGGAWVLWPGGGPQHVIVSDKVYGMDRTPASNIERLLPCGIQVLKRAPTAEESLPPLEGAQAAKPTAVGSSSVIPSSRSGQTKGTFAPGPVRQVSRSRNY